jgi:hypothetical protein
VRPQKLLVYEAKQAILLGLYAPVFHMFLDMQFNRALIEPEKELQEL